MHACGNAGLMGAPILRTPVPPAPPTASYRGFFCQTGAATRRVRNDTPRASGGRSEAAQRAAHSVSKHRVISPTEWTAGTGPGEAHRAAENDFGPDPKRAKPVRDTCTRGWWMARAGVGAGMRPGIDVLWHARACILAGVDVVVDQARGGMG
eukprot:jgi/Mesvir1/22095/Mv06661-RA.1